jgi:hypothetical protein
MERRRGEEEVRGGGERRRGGEEERRWRKGGEKAETCASGLRIGIMTGMGMGRDVDTVRLPIVMP